MNNNPNKHLHNLYLLVGIIVACIVIWQFVAPKVLSINGGYGPIKSTPQQIDVPDGVSQSILTGDCVDTFNFANIHATYVVVFDHGPSKRVKITEDGTVIGTATIYRNSGCYSS